MALTTAEMTAARSTADRHASRGRDRRVDRQPHDRPGRGFFAIKGDRVDGHNTPASPWRTRGPFWRQRGKAAGARRITVPMIVVDDVLAALGRLGVAARAPNGCQNHRGYRIGRQDHHQGDAASSAGAFRQVHAAVASFNNHWGVPLTLSRMSGGRRIRRLRDRHEPFRRNPPLTQMSAACRHHHHHRRAHLGNFSSLEEIAAAKAEIFEGVEPGGHAILNRDNEQVRLPRERGGRGRRRTYPFLGQQPRRTSGWRISTGRRRDRPSGDHRRRDARADDRRPGRHIAETPWRRWVRPCSPADLQEAIASLQDLKAVKGRAAPPAGDRPRQFLHADRRELQCNSRLDAAALALLASSQPEGEGRVIAILGDMLEMGAFSREVHADLSSPLLAAGIETVWLAGAEMAHLRDALPASIQVEYRHTEELAKFVSRRSRPVTC